MHDVLQVANSFWTMQKLKERVKVCGLEIHIGDEILTFLGSRNIGQTPNGTITFNKTGGNFFFPASQRSGILNTWIWLANRGRSSCPSEDRSKIFNFGNFSSFLLHRKTTWNVSIWHFGNFSSFFSIAFCARYVKRTRNPDFNWTALINLNTKNCFQSNTPEKK